MATRKAPDSMEQYRHDFGYLGSFIHEAVCQLRAKQAPTTSLLNRPATTMVGDEFDLDCAQIL